MVVLCVCMPACVRARACMCACVCACMHDKYYVVDRANFGMELCFIVNMPNPVFT